MLLLADEPKEPKALWTPDRAEVILPMDPGNFSAILRYWRYRRSKGVRSLTKEIHQRDLIAGLPSALGACDHHLLHTGAGLPVSHGLNDLAPVGHAHLLGNVTHDRVAIERAYGTVDSDGRLFRAGPVAVTHHLKLHVPGEHVYEGEMTVAEGHLDVLHHGVVHLLDLDGGVQLHDAAEGLAALPAGEVGHFPVVTEGQDADRQHERGPVPGQHLTQQPGRRLQVTDAQHTPLEDEVDHLGHIDGGAA